MKFSIYISLVILFSCSAVKPLPRINDTDSLITSIISEVDSDSIRYIIQNLQDLQTRFLLTPNRFSAADWIENRFHEIGITNVERDSFMCHTTYMMDTTTLQVNIIGTITGTTRPDEVYIIGGHYDCFAYGDPLVSAPGADDNASGTASALEFARVLIKSGYQPEATIKFITFAAEELMLFGDCGSRHYAQEAKADSMDIRMMINCDMISYTSRPVEQSFVDINYYSGFELLRDLAMESTNKFSLITAVQGGLNNQSDSYPFFEQGYPAVYFEENDFSPFYHTTGDTIGNYNMDFCGEVIKSAGATILNHMLQNPVGNTEKENILPDHISLNQNYPNPFNPVTSISFEVDQTLFITLKVYDVLGMEVATVVNEEKSPGNYVINFDGSELAGGVYFYRLSAGKFESVKKMVLLK